MARIRTIKPEFWTDSKTGTLTEFGKCLFLGLLNQCDDYGVIEWQPLEWRAKIFPYHSDTTHGAVTSCLADELLPRGLVVYFANTTDDGEIKRYLCIRNFNKHQVVNRPGAPLLEGWKKGDTPTSYAKRLDHGLKELGKDFDCARGEAVSTHTPLIEHSSPERKGKEGKGKEDAPDGATKELFGTTESDEPDPPPKKHEPPTTAETDLFRRGRELLGPTGGGLVKKLLTAKQGSIPLARAALEVAATKHDAREYIGACLRDRSAADGLDPAIWRTPKNGII